MTDWPCWHDYYFVKEIIIDDVAGFKKTQWVAICMQCGAQLAIWPNQDA